ncbi:Panacea domain-containing protein [Lactiplantibacillus nangangensis]|uniref:Panacea domain-containing protein n=1 Tax=Lactiplantibacillus nangangensis TaxID=2559917 RepID=A0ABW1SHJ3_9LACO|nr:type II toxin-antitoxin system antitoxin SocA domain-containing protein [Lactiplantibacillus nangangensis]
MSKEYTADTIAKWFLTRSSMSPKKLQKMIYYAYSWVLTLMNDNSSDLKNKLFDDEFEAWVHGPVIPSIYAKYADYGYHDIEKYVGEESPKVSADIEDILNQVNDVYGGYTADELESMTHQETPWKNARNGYSPIELCQEEISDRDIYDCYIKRVA